jgi:hypothetical protein
LSSILHRIDQKEKARVLTLEKELEKKKTINTADAFDSETIPQWLKEKPISSSHSFRANDVVLPLNCVLYSKVLLSICPRCECVANPELLKPYLDRELVLPILTADMQGYTAKFARMITEYPYIGRHTLLFLKLHALSHKRVLCPHCYHDAIKDIDANLNATSLAPQRKTALKYRVHHLLAGSLFPTFDPEIQILRDSQEAARSGNARMLLSLVHQADILHRLRVSSLFDAVPNVLQEDLQNIVKLARELGLKFDESFTGHLEEAETVMRSLNLEYSPSMSVEQYLDIMLPRRKKITKLVDLLLSSGSNRKESHVKRLNDEIWEINRQISTSRGLELLSFVTEFASDNIGIITGLLVGGFLGYTSASFAGCGIGGMAGASLGAAGRLLTRPFKVRKLPAKTIEWMEAKIEGPGEKLMSMALAKDLPTIQVYQLRKKLKTL